MSLIVISDLHLSAGLDDEMKRYSRLEDFFFDNEFERFLKFLQKQEPGKTHLVIAGDMFDFLQIDGNLVTKLVQKGAPFSMGKRELRYGLGTEADKTVWKLGKITQGHKVFFDALSLFLSHGNTLSIITGNHDIELHWKKVQEALINYIADRAPNPRLRKKIKTRIKFHPWFYYDKHYQTYIEHGNQYDSLNSFEFFLYPVLPPDFNKILLPLGSFFVRYFFNQLEAINPFADNIKPPTKYLGWTWHENKVHFLKTILHYIPAMLQAFLKSGKLTRAEKQKLTEENADRLQKLCSEYGLTAEALERIDKLKIPPVTRKKLIFILNFIWVFFALVVFVGFIALLLISRIFGISLWKLLSSLQTWLPLIGLFIVALIKWTRSKLSKDPLHEILKRIKENLKEVKVIIFSHTHDPDIRRIDKDTWYYNTGTWTVIFSEEEKLIREEKQFAFVEIETREKEPVAELLRWNNALGIAERLILFERTEDY